MAVLDLVMTGGIDADKSALGILSSLSVLMAITNTVSPSEQ
jgi:hypothetical protein